MCTGKNSSKFKSLDYNVQSLDTKYQTLTPVEWGGIDNKVTQLQTSDSKHLSQA